MSTGNAKKTAPYGAVITSAPACGQGPQSRWANAAVEASSFNSATVEQQETW